MGRRYIAQSADTALSTNLNFFFFFLFIFLIPERDPREDAVSPACRKRRLKGRRYIAIVADTA